MTPYYKDRSILTFSQIFFEKCLEMAMLSDYFIGNKIALSILSHIIMAFSNNFTNGYQGSFQF